MYGNDSDSCAAGREVSMLMESGESKTAKTLEIPTLRVLGV